MATATPLTAPNTFLPVDAKTKATFGAPMDAPENLLAHYFRDVAGLPVLQSEQEFEFAKDIEALEVSLWSQISNPALVEPLLGMLELRLEERPTEFTQLLRSSRALRTKAVASTRKRHERWSERVALQIRTVDVDRNILDEVLDHLGRLSRGQATALRAGRVNVKSKAFKKYYRKVRVLTRASQRARNEFVQANLRLVVTIARRFNYGHIPFHDLIQEGNIGLIKAVGRYDYRRGFRFSHLRQLVDPSRHHPGHRRQGAAGAGAGAHAVHLSQSRPHQPRAVSQAGPASPRQRRSAAHRRSPPTRWRRSRGTCPTSRCPSTARVSDDDDRSFIEMIQDESDTSPVERIGDQEVSSRCS